MTELVKSEITHITLAAWIENEEDSSLLVNQKSQNKGIRSNQSEAYITLLFFSTKKLFIFQRTVLFVNQRGSRGI